MSWHLTVCQSKQGGELIAQTFVHIIESGLQDSHTVVTVMEHVFTILKHKHPELTRVEYRQDNAGCYHCATTILECHLLREKTKMDLCQMDFCDPQGGKGPCDRKAEQIKRHVKQYINQGHSATTLADLKKAIKSNEGIPGVRVTVVPVAKTTVNTKTIKWEGISLTSRSRQKVSGPSRRMVLAQGISDPGPHLQVSMHHPIKICRETIACVRIKRITVHYTLFS